MALAAPPVVAAQGRVHREGGVDVVGVASRPTQGFIGGSLWWRPASRTRLGGLVAGGTSGRRAAFRGEVAVHFLLAPDATRGIAVYGGGGLALTAGEAREARLLVVLGVEARPGSARGWTIEAGVGGGLRLAVGWRWRSVRSPAAAR